MREIPDNTTKSSNSKIPVFVWIYGGGFTSGASRYPQFNGKNYPKHGVVKNINSLNLIFQMFVSLNYRLGPLGFLP